MKRFRIPAVIILTILAIACQKEPVLEVSGAGTLSFTRAMGTHTLSFNTNRDWVISSSEPWCKVSPASGSASKDLQTVNVSCETNNDYDHRQCVVTIKAGELQVTVSVFQDQKDAISVEENALIADGRAQDLTVAAMANVDVSVRIPSGVSWITPAPSTKGLSRKDIGIRIKDNGQEYREATIYLEKGDISVPVNVKQGPFFPFMNYSLPGVYGLERNNYAYRPGVDQYATGIRGNTAFFRLLDQEHIRILTITGIPLQDPGLFEKVRLGIQLVSEEEGTIYDNTVSATVISTSSNLLWLVTDNNEGIILKKQAL